jgi:methylenetetrahydrofolate reductase (NADPH)
MAADTSSGPVRRSARRTGQADRSALSRALRAISYEVLPFKGTEEKVLAHVPADVRLTVTTTAARGLEPTIDLAVRLSRHGYQAAPHLAARLVRDAGQLREIVARLAEAGVDGVFVIGGDAPAPQGPFPDALSLLEAMQATGHQFTRVGIGGYPEGHGHIGDDLIEQALRRKAPYATHLITQLCFAPRTTAAWARSVARDGVSLPVRAGIPGAVSRQKLIRISAGLGLGQSARFLNKQQSVLWRFFLPGGYSPDRLVTGLASSLDSPGSRIRGFHVFTFNELERTEAWRQGWLRRLS